MSKGSLLILIVACNDENRIQEVLKRIPVEVVEKYRYEILIIDDSSKDSTYENAQRFHEENIHLNIRILYNPVGQGYGGNQKLGYEYAIRNDFDVVLLLHGGGQYAPEAMDNLLLPLFEGNADAVIGSRMIRKGEALRGGMPLYKYAGNRLLTFLQNRLLKTGLSDLHSGYRAYSAGALKEIPFALNSNHFHFDTQMIIQLLLAGKKIAEVPIPAFYEKGIYDLNKIAFAWNVMRETIVSRLQKMALFYRREYDLVPFSEEYSLKLGYTSSHSLAISNIPEGSSVLDIGGGQGRIAFELKKKGCYVAGIDKNPLTFPGHYDLFYQRNLDLLEFDFNIREFSHILLLDIIEHLSYPENFLDLQCSGWPACHDRFPAPVGFSTGNGCQRLVQADHDGENPFADIGTGHPLL
jgi:glycosyltransferase involved in cell wall biosynthesis